MTHNLHDLRFSQLFIGIQGSFRGQRPAPPQGSSNGIDFERRSGESELFAVHHYFHSEMKQLLVRFISTHNIGPIIYMIYDFHNYLWVFRGQVPLTLNDDRVNRESSPYITISIPK